MTGALSGRVALVTGASRGAGRGIATELGAAGTTVYVTGRSSILGATTDDLPGTVEATAEEVCAAGGEGIPMVIDHTDDRAVAALFTRIFDRHGNLDLMVDNAWGGYEDPNFSPLAMAPFWELPLARWDRMQATGVRARIVAARHAVPAMVRAGRGLIVETLAWMPDRYLGRLDYDMAKHACARMVLGMGHDLSGTGVTAVALAPGFMATERVLEAFRRMGKSPQDEGGPSETPAYIGRAVVALASDPEVQRWQGQVLEVGTLAVEYGFTDTDGSRPPPFRP